MKNLSPKEAKRDNGFVIIFSLIILSMMMITGFAFVAETSLAKKSSRGYAQAVIVDELAKGILTTINHNIENTLKVHDSGKLEPTTNEQHLINNPEAHSMFHKYMAADGVSSKKEYRDIRVSFLSKEVADADAGSLTTPALKFYLGEDSDQFFSVPFEYQGYAEKSASKSNIRTPHFDGIDIHADEDDAVNGTVDGDGDGRIDNTPEWDYRYTYMIMSQIGKIDPNYAIDDAYSRQNNPPEVRESNIEERYNLHTKTNGNGIEVRDLSFTPSYSELNLAEIFDKSLIDNMQDEKPQQIGWASFTALSETLGLTDGSSDLSIMSGNSNYYALYPHSIEESLPAIVFGETESDEDFKYSLSDINRVHDQGSSVTPLPNSIPLLDDGGDPIENPIATPVFDDDGDGLPNVSIVKIIEDANVLEASAVSDGKKAGVGCSSHEQLGVNIIDYFDKDIVTTTNLDFTASYNNLSGGDQGRSPVNFAKDDKSTYAGLEKAPCINELLIRLNVEQNVDGSYLVKVNTNCRTELYLPPEWFQDPNQFKKSSWVSLSMEFSNGEVRTFRNRASNGAEPYVAGIYSSFNNNSTITNRQFTVSAEDALDFHITKIQVGLMATYEDDDGVVHSSGEGTGHGVGIPADVASVLIDGRTPKVDFGTFAPSPETPAAYIAINFEAKNPFQNSNPSDWVMGDDWYDNNQLGIDEISTIDKENLSVVKTRLSDDSDRMSTDDYNSLKAPLLRNKSPESLGELGAIQTGNPQQTIDLLHIPEDFEDPEGHFSLVNKFRLGDGYGMEKGGELPAVRARRFNPNSRYPDALKAAFSGISLPSIFPEELPASASDTFNPNGAHKDKLDHLISYFPGVYSPDDETADIENGKFPDFASTTDAFDVTPDEAVSIFGRETHLGSGIPDRNSIAYRRPFIEARDGLKDLDLKLNDREAERLFWETKDLMGAMNYFSIIYSIQAGKGENTTDKFTPKGGWFSYRAEVAYGLDPDRDLDPLTNPNPQKVMKVLSVRKTQ